MDEKDTAESKQQVKLALKGKPEACLPVGKHNSQS